MLGRALAQRPDAPISTGSARRNTLAKQANGLPPTMRANHVWGGTKASSAATPVARMSAAGSHTKTGRSEKSGLESASEAAKAAAINTRAENSVKANVGLMPCARWGLGVNSVSRMIRTASAGTPAPSVRRSAIVRRLGWRMLAPAGRRAGLSGPWCPSVRGSLNFSPSIASAGPRCPDQSVTTLALFQIKAAAHNGRRRK